MFIRRLDETDYLEYKTIRLEGLMKAPSSFGSSFEEENLFGDDIWKNRLENKNAITLGAFVDEKLVGVVTLLLNERIKTKHVADIHAMYVASSVQNQGIGTLLINKVISFVAEAEYVRQIKLSVEKLNYKAIRLYEKCGFRVYAEEKQMLCLDNVYYDFLLMNYYVKR
jgi:ribosomal protein S18 acetylase RimI-like enzyme